MHFCLKQKEIVRIKHFLRLESDDVIQIIDRKSYKRLKVLMNDERTK